MTIATKTRILTLLLLIISVTFGYSFWQTSRNLEYQRKNNNIIQTLIKNTFDFSFISNEYISNRNQRVQLQWANSHASLEATFSKATKNLNMPDDKASLKKMISDETQVEEFLAGLIANKELNDLSNPSLSRQKTQTISQIQVRIQGMLSEAQRVSKRSLNRLISAEQQLELTSKLLLVTYFILFIIALVFIRQKIIQPIIHLQKNAHQLALGHYDSRIPIENKDELSALAESYNTLASEIQKKIQSLTDKSNRLAASKVELLTLNDNLQQMVDEQTSDIRNNEHKQRAILDSMTDGVITMDQSFTIININPAVSEIFGYSSEDLINRKLNFLITNHDTATEQIDTFQEQEGHLKNGIKIPLETSLTGITVDNTIMYICIVRDITERKRVDKMKDEFVSTVSHELRTPLTSIRGALSLINSGALDKTPDKISELLETAGRNAERLMHLINDILDMQKIEAGKLEYNYKNIDLKDALEKAIADNLNYAKQYQVNIQLDDKIDELVIQADPLRLAQIMSNLISNAAKFSGKNSTIYIHTAIENDYAKISVVDSGEGIPAEYFNKIFRKFSQNDASATKERGGTGLGLAITKQMIEDMGGIIDFSSIEGIGTTFNIYLPLSKTKLPS